MEPETENLPARPDRIEPVVWLLFLGLVLSCVGLFAAEYFFKDDGQVFQVMAGLTTGFGASLMTRIKARGTNDSDNPPKPPLTGGTP